MVKNKKPENENCGKVYVNVKDARCIVCNSKLRTVTQPIKYKCDSCNIVYTINQFTGEVVGKFKSIVKVNGND